MSQTQENTKKTEFDGLYFLSLLFKNKIFILLFVFIITLGSVIYALMQDNWYVATVNVVPPRSSESLMENALGSISSTLKNFGLSKIGGGAASEGYSFLVILNSRTVKDSIINKYNLAERYDIPDSEKSIVISMFNENLDITYEEEGNYTVSIWDTDPQLAAEMANEYIRIANELAVKIFREEAADNLIFVEERVAKTDSVLVHIGAALEDYSRQKMIFSPEDQAKSISTALVELKLQEYKYEMAYDLNKSMYGEEDVKTKTYKELMNKTGQKLDDIKYSKGFGGNFSLDEASGVGIEYIKLYTEYETFTKLKAFLLPILEKSRLDVQKNIENLYVVDPAVAPDKKDKPKRSLIVAGSFFGSFILAVMIVLLLNGIKSFRRQYNEFYKNL